MSLKDTISDALKVYLNDVERLGDVAEVVDWEDDTEYSGGGCESCAFEYAVVDVWYKTTKGGNKTYRINKGFGELISQL